MKYIRHVLPIWVGQSECDLCGLPVAIIIANDPPDFDLLNAAERDAPVLCPNCASSVEAFSPFVDLADIERLIDAAH